MARDAQKALERGRKYRLKKRIEKYGPAAATEKFNGRHGNHARGERNGRWNNGRMRTSHGYVAVYGPLPPEDQRRRALAS
jgi:hypothetical protein